MEQSQIKNFFAEDDASGLREAVESGALDLETTVVCHDEFDNPYTLTLLAFATEVYCQPRACIQYLIEAGANCEAENTEDYDVLNVAIRSKDMWLLRLVCENQPPAERYMTCGLTDCVRIVQWDEGATYLMGCLSTNYPEPDVQVAFAAASGGNHPVDFFLRERLARVLHKYPTEYLRGAQKLLVCELEPCKSTVEALMADQ